MKKLSKEKQQHLVLVALLTVGGVVGLWFGVARLQRQVLADLGKKKASAQQESRTVNQTIANAAQIAADKTEAAQRLAKLEEGMASGDLYSWSFNTLRQFKASYKVEIPQFSQVEGPKEVTMLPHFPYKQATMTIAGTAMFHELGRFICDFENQFPYFRVMNLSIEPVSSGSGPDKEKLSFRMEVAALVKPGTS
jgi:hypothetical protein